MYSKGLKNFYKSVNIRGGTGDVLVGRDKIRESHQYNILFLFSVRKTRSSIGNIENVK